MNLFALFMIIIVGVVAVMAVALIGNQHQAPVVDTYGNTSSASTNASQAIAGNLTATGSQVGAGVVLLVGGIIAALLFLGFYMLVSGKKY